MGVFVFLICRSRLQILEQYVIRISNSIISKCKCNCSLFKLISVWLKAKSFQKFSFLLISMCDIVKRLIKTTLLFSSLQLFITFTLKPQISLMLFPSFFFYFFLNRHAKRTTVQSEDVKLLARRNQKLVKMTNNLFLTFKTQNNWLIQWYTYII